MIGVGAGSMLISVKEAVGLCWSCLSLGWRLSISRLVGRKCAATWAICLALMLFLASFLLLNHFLIHLTTRRKRMMRLTISTISQMGMSLKDVELLLISPTLTVSADWPVELRSYTWSFSWLSGTPLGFQPCGGPTALWVSVYVEANLFLDRLCSMFDESLVSKCRTSCVQLDFETLMSAIVSSPS